MKLTSTTLLLMLSLSASTLALACSCFDRTIEGHWEWALSDNKTYILPNVFLVELKEPKGDKAYFDVIDTYRGTAVHTPFISIDTVLMDSCSKQLPKDLAGMRWILFTGYPFKLNPPNTNHIDDIGLRSSFDTHSPFKLDQCAPYYIGTNANIKRITKLKGE